VVVVNEYLARTVWPGEDPIGQRIRIASAERDAWMRVAGVASNAVVAGWLAPDAPVSDVTVMTDAVRRALRGAGFVLTLLGAFAVVALVLASVGLYGVLSYSIALRRREIRIRLALGASTSRVVGGLVAEGLTTTALGAGLGAIGAVIFGRALSGLLVGVSPVDPISLATTLGVVIATSMLAGYLPARRAGRIDPQRELR
jgi:ABC-type antimicrobial peptide transport system permease subunit